MTVDETAGHAAEGMLGMGVRPGRVLPSVIAGGVLAAGMAFGVGTASAQASTTCLLGTETVSVGSLYTADPTTNKCRLVSTGELASVPSAPTSTPSAPTTTPSKPSSPSSNPAPVTTGTSSSAPQPTGSAAAGPKVVVVVPPPAAPPPAAPAPAAAPAGGTLSAAQLRAPGYAISPGAFGSAPVAPGLFGVGGYNPGLLLSAPLGSPLRNLAAADPASAVTTASQVQAMAFDNLPGGPGLPATLGVLILAGLGGFAVRHRILKRLRGDKATESV